MLGSPPQSKDSAQFIKYIESKTNLKFMTTLVLAEVCFPFFGVNSVGSAITHMLMQVRNHHVKTTTIYAQIKSIRPEDHTIVGASAIVSVNGVVTQHIFSVCVNPRCVRSLHPHLVKFPRLDEALPTRRPEHPALR